MRKLPRLEQAVICVYITTNLVNNKQYIGTHSTNYLNDKYLGSGSLIITSIKKYGRSNFRKDILFICENMNDAYEKESFCIEKFNTLVPNGYNISPSGQGVTILIDKGLAYNKASKEQIIINRENQSIRMKEMWANPELRADLIIKINESQKDPAVQERKSISMKKTLNLPTVKEKMSKRSLKQQEKKIQCTHCGGTYQFFVYNTKHGERCSEKPLMTYEDNLL